LPKIDQTSRLLVHTSIYESFIAAFRAQVSQISIIGDPFSPSTFQGPQISRAQYDRVREYIRIGEAEGAKLVEPSATASESGLFIPPTIFRDVHPSMRIFNEEVFGPLVCITPFNTEAEAIALANDSVYGLGAAVFTRDIAKAHRVARRLEAGMVWINSSNDGDCRIPFGGVKQSGIGRELGEEGLRAYSVEKSVHVNLGA
jgi:aldehyde dehydrogenase (NAD+)